MSSEKSWWDNTADSISQLTEDSKEFVKDSQDAVKNSKDAKNITSQFDNLIDQSSGGVTRFYDALTGQVVEGQAAEKIKAIKASIKGPTSVSTNTINPTSVEPIVGSINPIYTGLGDAESYKIETAGKANSGNNTDSAGTLVPGPKQIPFSLFNHWSLMNYKGGPLDNLDKEAYNAPLFAGADRIEYRNPTATKIIQTLNEKDHPGYKYSFSDFALAKYYGKISNNFMVTLRRFPMPVEDDIINPKVLGPDGKSIVDNAMPDLARAVTWMSEATGNKLNDLLKFDVSTTWKEVESAIQERSGGGEGGALGSAIGGNFFASAAIGAANGMDAQGVANAKSGYDATKGTYPNHIFGPINVIKKVSIRDAGLNFTGDMELTFHYSLRQLEGVSPKIAFLDMLSNMLVLTYNNGNFWGGSSRYVGGSGKMSRPFGDFSKLKSGNFGEFLGSIVGDIAGAAGAMLNDVKDNGLTGSKLGKNLIGGGLMKLFGTPQGSEALNAFLTGDPTGQYHVTIGNPLNPIAVIGNLYCDKADFQFGGELSYEGFPTELTVKVSLKPARPRDKADIERMFNGGKQRMYLTPENGVNTNNSTNTSAYGNADSPEQADIYRKMTGG